MSLLIQKQTRDTAWVAGLRDRGVLSVGKRADINVINLEALHLTPPRMEHDLPLAGARILQGATGYDATIVGGVVTRRYDEDTQARPGRLVRSAVDTPH